MEKIFKFSGAGNDFVVLDGRKADVSAYRQPERIGALCREYKTDGLMILGTDPKADFSMEFYNPDGSGGMMCGNGGRCIVAFADMLGLVPASGETLFRAPDGLHTATILSRPPAEGTLPETSLRDHRGPRESSITGVVSVRANVSGRVPSAGMGTWIVRLKMIDVQGITPAKGGYFLNTGTRHLVQFVDDADAVDIEKEGPALRWDKEFAPEGTNVNFVQATAEGLKVRTFEKGVEGETLACGTGLTASAIAAYKQGIPASGPQSVEDTAALQTVKYRLQCRRGDWLSVDFVPGEETFTQVFLTGPAECLTVSY